MFFVFSVFFILIFYFEFLFLFLGAIQPKLVQMQTHILCLEIAGDKSEKVTKVV